MVRSPAHRRHALGIALLLVVTTVWGSTFAVVKNATDALHPATLILWRFLVGTVCLLPLFLWRGAAGGARPSRPARWAGRADCGWTA